ncbi:MAG: hypothetical protein ACOC0P_03605 [Planctomycetota bacterium]
MAAATSRNQRGSSATAAADDRRHYSPKLYDEEGDLLVHAEGASHKLTMLPSGNPREAHAHVIDRMRIQWGQHLLADLVAGRYRTLVCAVNPEDNTHGILAQLSRHLPTSQWNAERITHFSKIFAQSIHEGDELVLKFDLDQVLALALLRPPGRDHFTLEDLRRGFHVVAEMLDGRRDRWPCASVAFLGAKTNRVRDENGEEPSFETILRIMYEQGYRGDVYPSLGMWDLEHTGVFSSYPFPESLDVMRSGGC